MFAGSTGSAMRTMPLLADRLSMKESCTNGALYSCLLVIINKKEKEKVKDRWMLFLMTVFCMAHGLSGHPRGKESLGEPFHTGWRGSTIAANH